MTREDYHFLQPTLFTGHKISIYEYQLRNSPYLVAKGIEKALTDLHVKYAVSTFDISGLFDVRPRGNEYFLDWVFMFQKKAMC